VVNELSLFLATLSLGVSFVVLLRDIRYNRNWLELDVQTAGEPSEHLDIFFVVVKRGSRPAYVVDVGLIWRMPFNEPNVHDAFSAEHLSTTAGPVRYPLGGRLWRFGQLVDRMGLRSWKPGSVRERLAGFFLPFSITIHIFTAVGDEPRLLSNDGQPMIIKRCSSNFSGFVRLYGKAPTHAVVSDSLDRRREVQISETARSLIVARAIADAGQPIPPPPCPGVQEAEGLWMSHEGKMQRIV
jgi:hypothetical protein